MELQEIINRNLIRYSQTLQHFASTGRGDPESAVNQIVTETWETLVARYNAANGSKGRKPVESVLEEAERRGFSAQRPPGEENIILQKVGIQFSYQKRNGGRYIFCTSFSHVPPIKAVCRLAIARVTPCRVSLEATPLFDCMEELIAAIPAIRSAVNGKILDLRREGMIADISLPSLTSMAEKALGPKGIKYYVGRNDSGDFIQVNISKNLWFGGPVTLVTFEHILGLVPYGIMRPDRIKQDVSSSFRVDSDWWGRHEDAWKRYRERLDRPAGLSDIQ